MNSHTLDILPLVIKGEQRRVETVISRIQFAGFQEMVTHPTVSLRSLVLKKLVKDDGAAQVLLLATAPLLSEPEQ